MKYPEALKDAFKEDRDLLISLFNDDEMAVDRWILNEDVDFDIFEDPIDPAYFLGLLQGVALVYGTTVEAVYRELREAT